MNVYGLSEGQGLDHCIKTAIQVLGQGQSVNLHSARSRGYYCFSALNNSSAISFIA